MEKASTLSPNAYLSSSVYIHANLTIFADILNPHRTLRPSVRQAVHFVGASPRFGPRRQQAAAEVQPGDRLAPASRHQTVPRAAHPRSPADRGGPFRRHLRPPGSHLTRGSETGAPRERGLRSYHERYHKQEGAVKAFSKRNPAVSILPISYFSSSDAFCQ